MAAPLSLVFDILARDQGASRTFNNVGDSAEKAGKSGERAGNLIKGGALAIAAGLAAAGVASLGFVKDAAESAKIGRLTEAVIKSTGGAAKLTADQVGDLATAISNKTAVDDEAIQEGTNLLLTFTKIRNEVGKGNDIFNQAAQAAVDMSVALGTDVKGASIQLGKALNDPIKGVTALSKAGVSFTQQQKDQIKEMVKAGDTLGAQKIILSEMQTQFGGAAAAAADPMERLKVIAGNLGEEIGGGLLPYVERFATFASDKLIPAVGQVVDILFKGDFTGGPFAEDSPIVNGLFNLREGFATLKDVAGQAFDILFRGDFTGGPLSEDSAVVDKLFDLRDGFMAVRDFVRDEVGPRLLELRARFDEDVAPAIGKVRDFLVTQFQPAFEKLVTTFNESVRPSLLELKAAFDENRPAIDLIAKVVGTVVVAFLAMHQMVLARVLPILGELAAFLFGRFADALGWVWDRTTDLVDAVRSAADWFGTALSKVTEFTDKLDDYKLPGWVQRLADVVGGVAGSLGSAASRVAGFLGQGDGPGRYAGGNTLNRVKGLLPAGAQITSTYRTPAQNAAVGGVTGSYHTDRANPAVDIAGSRAAMDQVYARLSAMGGWRELLYKTAGHWDHVHVAHQGGTVSSGWPTMPGLRTDERPVIAQVGETIYPKGTTGGAAELPPIYIQNPFTGEYLLAQVDQRAAGVADRSIRLASVRPR